MVNSGDKSWGGGTPDDAPEYVFHRLQAWEKAVEKRKFEQRVPTPGPKIAVKLKDGKEIDGRAMETTPASIAKELGGTEATDAIVALVNDKMWDMSRPLEEDCTVAFCGFDSPEGKNVLWHSTAHMLGEAMEYKYKGELCIGPPLEDGFYYDIHLGDGTAISEEAFKDLENRVEKIAKSKRNFERLELSKDEALDMFSYNKFKLEIINKLEEGTTITAYRDGPFIDLCRGPHVPNSAKVKSIMMRKTGSAYWLGKAENPSLQRVYGISFPDKARMKEYKTMLEEAAKRDHRLIGKNQELFFFSALSPGSCFLLPHGCRIYNTLMGLMRTEYWKRGYEEVQTPNIFDFQLWETSGHAQNYKENMFSFEVEKREYGLKPMNCPGHCVMFASRARSYKELPIRYAEFGVLHRNELSGTLGGLTRVRRFVQDDAHIFCTPDQVTSEVVAFLNFMKYVYDIMGFSFELELSTRPEKYLGEIELWDLAEQKLSDALDSFTGKKCGDGWQLNPADGAFYGPKIDIKVYDALRRRHQCATVQLDFQLPIRFNLQYQAPISSHAASSTENGKANGKQGEPAENGKVESAPDTAPQGGVEEDKATANEAAAKTDEGPRPEKATQISRPVIIHRAIFGSFERFFAVITEHFGGKWPLWLSPRQAIVVPVSDKYVDYGKQVQSELLQSKFFVDVDTTDRKLAKKVREAQLAQYNFILVVGEKELEDHTVNVRTRENAVQGVKGVEDFRSELEELRRNFQ